MRGRIRREQAWRRAELAAILQSKGGAQDTSSAMHRRTPSAATSTTRIAERGGIESPRQRASKSRPSMRTKPSGANPVAEIPVRSIQFSVPSLALRALPRRCWTRFVSDLSAQWLQHSSPQLAQQSVVAPPEVGEQAPTSQTPTSAGRVPSAIGERSEGPRSPTVKAAGASAAACRSRVLWRTGGVVATSGELRADPSLREVDLTAGVLDG